jgi:hypothetical protein
VSGWSDSGTARGLERAEAATPEESDIGEFIDRLRQATQRALLNDQAKRLDDAIAPPVPNSRTEERLKRLVLSASKPSSRRRTTGGCSTSPSGPARRCRSSSNA